MTVFFVLVGLSGLVVLLFVFTHLGPLDRSEVQRLGIKRRNNEVRRYYSFVGVEYTIDREFKKRMNPNGSFYDWNEDLRDFPSVAAALLKYKKHEWIIVAFEKGQTVELMWLNKGFDRSSVALYLPIEKIAEIAANKACFSVLIFHNHPNSNPSELDCSQPSEMDLKTAIEFARVLNDKGVNLVEFVCERGSHYEYYLSPSECFVPLREIILTIEAGNGLSRMSNLSLHWERLF